MWKLRRVLKTTSDHEPRTTSDVEIESEAAADGGGRRANANQLSIGVVGGGIDSTAASASFGGVSGKTPALVRVEFCRRRRDEKSTQNRRGSRLAVSFGGDSACLVRNVKGTIYLDKARFDRRGWWWKGFYCRGCVVW